jgi:hypothetical protein
VKIFLATRVIGSDYAGRIFWFILKRFLGSNLDLNGEVILETYSTTFCAAAPVSSGSNGPSTDCEPHSPKPDRALFANQGKGAL